METTQKNPAPQPYRTRPAIPTADKASVQVTMADPVVVSMAAPQEHHWGYWQFPTVSRLPGGELLLTVNNCHDDDLCYGHAAPAWLSHDQGLTWHAADIDEKLLTVAHSPVFETFNGEFMAIPLPLGMRPDEMPEGALQNPVGSFVSYVTRLLYPLERFGPKLQDTYSNLRGMRWSPSDRLWHPHTVKWDIKGALLRLEDGGAVGKAISPTSLEYRPIKVGNELIDVNYKLQYLHADGSCPKGFEVVCMASSDNGASWHRRGLVAHDPDGIAHPNEASVSLTSNGDLVCVARLTDHRQLPLWVTFSKDQGRTWSDPLELLKHGVLPTLQRLDNGVLVLTTGRPGVQLLISPDGSGRSWTAPYDVLPSGIPHDTKMSWIQLHENPDTLARIQRCGYTSIIPTGPDTFLVVYTDTAHIDRRARLRKALIARSITVKPVR